jgi:tetratricopeptide (TPR) repeat protein
MKALETMSRRALGIGLFALGALLPLAPVHADDLKDGRQALQEGRLEDAVKSFDKAASQGFAEGRAGVGQVRLKQLRLNEAMVAFQTAQKMDANLALPYYGQGEVLRRKERCAEALPLFQKAVELDRKFPEANLALGDCLVKSGKVDEAINALNPGLKWGPKWRPRFLVAVGDAELSRDSLRAAASYYTRAREEAPNDPIPSAALGNYYLARGTYELAVPELQRAVSLDTSDVELRYGLGRAYAMTEQYREALAMYRDVVERAPDFPPGQYSLADLYYRWGRGQGDKTKFADALPPAEQYVKLAPNESKGLALLGRIYYQTGNKDQAFDLMNKAEALGEKNKEMYTLRARINAEKKNWDAALADYAKGEAQPEDAIRIAQVHSAKGNMAAAESVYTSMIATDSTTWSAKFAMLEMGKMYYRQKNYPAAVAAFNRRIALDPNTDEAYYYLGLSEKEQKHTSESVAALRQAANLAPEKYDRRFWLGMVYAEADSVPAAKRELSKAVELDSAGTNKNTGFALRQLGYYALLAKEYGEAIRLLERAVTIIPQDVQTWIWLGQGHHNSGNKGRACEAYDRALSLKPDEKVALAGKKTLGCAPQ